MPDITFINSPRTEEERINFTRESIEQGFYQRNGFVVLPTLDARVDSNALVIYPPQLEYVLVDPDIYQREWDKVSELFWQELEYFLPGSKTLHKDVLVKLTRYGTVSSIEDRLKQGSRAIYYLRADVDLSHLAAMIVNASLHLERKNLGITWSKREALMDFIMTRPTMKQLFPHFHPVFHQLSRVPARVRKQSEMYVRSLGFPLNTVEFEVKNGKILLRGVVIGKALSKTEKLVMKTLIEHLGELVTYDELADVVWGAGEFKTFWAINKLVERLRIKLIGLGVDGKRIESVRGQGYLLR